MRTRLLAFGFVSSLLGAAAAVSLLPSLATAHESHQAECTETAMNALYADIQAMEDGEAKTKAIQEMTMAKEMLANDDMEGCKTHMHKAMEAAEG